jgi:hypothetical protein
LSRDGSDWSGRLETGCAGESFGIVIAAKAKIRGPGFPMKSFGPGRQSLTTSQKAPNPGGRERGNNEVQGNGPMLIAFFAITSIIHRFDI